MEVLQPGTIEKHGPMDVNKARRGMLSFRSTPNLTGRHGLDADDDRVQNVRAAIKGAVLELPAMPKMTPKPGMFKSGHMRRLSRSMPTPSMQQALAEMARDEQPRAVDDTTRKATLLAIMEDIQQEVDEKPKAINYVEWACRELGIDPATTCSGRASARRAVEADEEGEEEEELSFEEMLSDTKGRREGAASGRH